jgi:hypothetical protein
MTTITVTHIILSKFSAVKIRCSETIGAETVTFEIVVPYCLYISSVTDKDCRGAFHKFCHAVSDAGLDNLLSLLDKQFVSA